MNLSVVNAVFRRDLRAWFGNPTGYVFIMMFVLVAAAALVLPAAFFRNSLANLDTLNELFPLLLALFAPAITMGMWASERTQGTQELLFTLPARDADILLGKFLAVLGVYTASLLFMLTLPVGLGFLGSPDWGQLFANFLGYWLLGVLLLSVAMLGSQFSDNLAVAFAIGAIGCVVVLYVGVPLQMVWRGLGAAWNVNGPLGQFAEFARGLVPASGLLLFLGLGVAFLYANLALLAARTARAGGNHSLHGTVRFLAMGVGSVSLTIVAIFLLPRVDVTAEQIHSLSAETRKLLAELPDDKPVFVKAYLSEHVPQEAVTTKRNLQNLLDQYAAIGGAAVQVSVELVEAFSEEARAAEQNFGIQPRVLMSMDGASSSENIVFMGLAFQCGTEEVVIPFIERNTPIEYEITRSIRTVANAQRRKVGLLKTDVELAGGFDFQTFQQKTRWQVADELKLQYQVDSVDPDKDYPADVEAMIVPQVSSLSQEQMDRLRTWLEAGHPALLIEDPEPLDAPGTSATDPKGGQPRNPMMQQPPPGEKGDLDGFLSRLGLSFNKNEVVWDSSFRTFPMPVDWPEFLFVGQDGMSATDPVTAPLQRVVLMMAGHLRIRDRDGVTVTPLLKSKAEISGTIPKLDLFQFNPFGGPKIPNTRRRHRPNTQEYVLAARVTGKPAEGATKGLNCVVLADLDLISNQFFSLRKQVTDANLQFDNVPFVLNCIDHLLGDQSLIELRSRRPVLRTLERVQEAQKAFEDQWVKQREAAEEKAEKELADAQGRLDAAVAAVTNNQALDQFQKDMQVEQIRQVEQRKLDLARSRIEDEKRLAIERAGYLRNAQKRRVQAGYQAWTIGLTPVPALLVGLIIFIRRRAREARIVPGSRLVGGAA